MKRFALTALAGMLGAGLLVAAPGTAVAQRTAPPGGEYKNVSTLVPLPNFVPGLGVLYVVPSTLPAGPFLAYDHAGKLVSSIYMIPLKDMNAQKSVSYTHLTLPTSDHVDIVFNLSLI